MSTSHEPARLLRNWRDELDSAALYAALAQIERDPRQRGVYEELASAEQRHAAFWEERLRAAGRPSRRFAPRCAPASSFISRAGSASASSSRASLHAS